MRCEKGSSTVQLIHPSITQFSPLISMRIRRRPPLPLSPPLQNPNLSSLQIQEPTNYMRIRDYHGASGLHPDGDLSASKPQSDPHPKQVFKEEKYAPSSSSSYKRTSDAQVHDDERNIGGEMERVAKDKSIDTLSNHQESTNTSSNNDDRVVVGEVEAIVVINGRKRRSPAPAVLVEGSRCSRVNGRGWRCNQQTLIGYSLCEHHLSKGRLRSIGGIRGGGRQKPKSNARKTRKIRERVSVVKARSISSLLSEAAAASPAAAMASAAGSDMALV